ncbi:thiaminase II [Pedobacter sp. MR2016-24]|uniref:thiaminase II n=1 Tax=Pedobacter sp. MR2016-24 TaxID=2994466 RepID=UPI0022474763|nr:thiaminase II [Pedobacter sp. MR2016-24]MCX2486449.1 thiaminase II [Pedobacter sp. MR2016-24]
MKWSEHTWNKTSEIYNRILNMPFITQLAAGTLDIEKFKFYMVQDANYLEYFGRTLSLIAARVPDIGDVLHFIRFAEGAIVVENELHESYFKEFGIEEKAALSPTCHHYIHFMQSTAALAQVETAVAAVLPCFWIYKKVGDFILESQGTIHNPYRNWINTYAGDEFGLLVQKAIDICDKAAEQCTLAQQEKMTEAFITASRLEWAFWNSAWEKEKW